MKPSVSLITVLAAVLLFPVLSAGAYEVSLHGGPIMDIPEAWVLSDGDPSVPTWYSADGRGAAEVMLWAPGTWDVMQDFADAVRPDGAEGDIMAFPCWSGEAAIADWSFPIAGTAYRGWFLMVRGDGPDIRISAIAAEEDFAGQQAFLLSILDSYMPDSRYRLQPGAVSRFLELSGPEGMETAQLPFNGETLTWKQSAAADIAAQDVIEREALLLASYAGNPDLFYPAWERYYRLIYRDSYSRLDSLAAALDSGPLPVATTDPRDAAVTLLTWLQGFSYGSTDGFSDLLAPPAACASGTGDCDSLALVLLMLMDRYGTEGRILISHQAHHAVAALDVPGRGMRYSDDAGTWIVAELTSALPLGRLPERLNGVNDWFGIILPTLDAELF